jgi:hypothetical protein
MPRVEILSKQALHTLTQLHAELAGKVETNRQHGDKLRAQMVQVEAVIKMLVPDFSVASIAAKRRNKVTRGSSAGRCLGVRWTCCGGPALPMTAREIADTLIADKAPQATRKQAIDLQAAILAALRKRDGMVVGEGSPARWKLAFSG